MVVERGHVCTLCKYKFAEEQCELLDNLPQEENKLVDDEKISLVYIAGYVTRKDLKVSEDTFFYYEKYGSYTQHLDRGGLKHANDLTCQWVIFSHIIFDNVKDHICQKSISEIFLYISESYVFDRTMYHCRTHC